MFNYQENKNIMETERLILRRFVMSDADYVAQMCNNYDVYKTTLALPHPYTRENAVKWISCHDEYFRTEHFFDFAITDKKSGTLYGCVGLSPNSKELNGELGYWIGKEYWGCGYATEAVQAMIKYAFCVKGYHRVYARHFASNPASGRVMQKCGMTCEGMMKEKIFKIDRYEDVVYYEIINIDMSENTCE